MAKAKALRLTPAQRLAVLDRAPGSLLISAAAGSGKTAVLTERLLQRAMASLIDWRDVLVVTFTDKAARQLRTRMLGKLNQAIEDLAAGDFEPLLEAPGSPAEQLARLKQLVLELPLATISTIHSFCLDLLRRAPEAYTDATGRAIFEPGFAVLSTDEAELLLMTALDDCLRQRYAALDRLDQADLAAAGIERADEAEAEANMATAGADGATAATDSDLPWTAADLQNFRRLALLLAPGYNDSPLRATVLKLYRQLRSLPNYNARLQEFLADDRALLAEPSEQPPLNERQKTVLQHILLRAERELAKIPKILHVLEANEFLAQARLGTKSKEGLALVENWPQWKALWEQFIALPERTWDDYFELGQKLESCRLPQLKAPTEKDKLAGPKSEWIAVAGGFAPLWQMLGANFTPSQKIYKERNLQFDPPYFTRQVWELRADEKRHAPLRMALYQLLLDLDLAYAGLKRRRQAADYSDFEHGALAALANGLETGAKELYIDEYQDTSPLQEAILNALPCERRFLVGDLKQSIYRFRNADPGLFQAKMGRYQKLEAGEAAVAGTAFDAGVADVSAAATADVSVDGAAASAGDASAAARERLIFFRENFRTAPDLLDYINPFFAFLMQDGLTAPEDAGGFSYDQDQALRPGRKRLALPWPRLRIVCCHKASAEEIAAREDAADEDPDLAEALEADAAGPLAAIADPEIRRVLEIILDAKRRGRDYGDIVILARSHSTCQAYVEALHALNIPVSGGRSVDTLASEELQILGNLIELLLQRQQDLPLAGLMLSDLCPVAFTEEDCLEIAQFARETLSAEARRERSGGLYFWQAVEHYAAQAPAGDLQARVAELLETLDLWRTQLGRRPAAELLSEIVEDSYWRLALAEDRKGTERLERLDLMLAALAKRERRAMSLLEFWQQFVYAQTRQIEWDDFSVAPAAEGAVRVMTMHAAKGLEFKMVILPALGKALQLDDKSSGTDPLKRSSSVVGFSLEEAELTHKYVAEHGALGTELYASPFMLEQQRLNRQRNLQEAYRLLYVAMTRAEEELVLVASDKGDLPDRLQRLFAELDDPERFPRPLAPYALALPEQAGSGGSGGAGGSGGSSAASSSPLPDYFEPLRWVRAFHAVPAELARSLQSYWEMLLAFLRLEWPEAYRVWARGQTAACGDLLSFEFYQWPSDKLLPLGERLAEALVGAQPEALDALCAVMSDQDTESDQDENNLVDLQVAPSKAIVNVTWPENGLPYADRPETLESWVQLLRPGIDRPDLLALPAKITVTEWQAAERSALDFDSEDPATSEILRLGLKDMALELLWPEELETELAAAEAATAGIEAAAEGPEVASAGAEVGPEVVSAGAEVGPEVAELSRVAEGELVAPEAPASSTAAAAEAAPGTQESIWDLFPTAALPTTPAQTASQTAAQTAAQSKAQAEAPKTAATSAKRQPDPRRLGTLAHRFLQVIDYRSLGDLGLKARPNLATATAAVRDALVHAQHEGLFGGEDLALLADNAKLFARFFASDLGRRVLNIARAGGPVFREIPFTMTRSAGIPGEDEWVLVQGMVDLAFIEDGKVVLIDYKTDHVAYQDGRKLDVAEQDALITERYGLQVQAYAEALERSLKLPCEERYLFLLREGRAVPVAEQKDETKMLYCETEEQSRPS